MYDSLMRLRKVDPVYPGSQVACRPVMESVLFAAVAVHTPKADVHEQAASKFTVFLGEFLDDSEHVI